MKLTTFTTCPVALGARSSATDSYGDVRPVAVTEVEPVDGGFLITFDSDEENWPIEPEKSASMARLVDSMKAASVSFELVGDAARRCADLVMRVPE